jgi:integrase
MTIRGNNNTTVGWLNVLPEVISGMEEQQISIEGLLGKYEKALTDYGYGFATKMRLMTRADAIIHLHDRLDTGYLDDQVLADYSHRIAERFYRGEINQKTHLSSCREIERFLNFAKTGSLKLTNPMTGCRQALTSDFERIAAGFIDTVANPNSRNDARWIAHKYLAWLTEQGIEDVRAAGAAEIQKFILACSKNMSMNSIRTVKLYLTKLYDYLFHNGMTESAYHDLLTFTVKYDSKVYPFLPREDIAKLLDTIDRKTGIGKRDYAIMMLGTVLGLRACDIVALKTSDIDWQRGELTFVQAKTGKTAVLPLTQDVGEALEDYILNARPDTGAKHIFLRENAPHTPIVAAVTIGEIFERCCKKAGLPTSKQFHNLRRSLATSMAMNGISVYAIADSLSDVEIDSVKPYIASDREHLKMCALSFNGIAPIGGVA